VSGSNVVGGLVGENDSFASITDSYATASVNGTSGSEYVGGLLGNNYLGSVIYSYATGRVSGSEYVGGLVGYNEAPQGPDYSNSVIVNSYATGGVSGSSNVGGLVGFNDSANGARVSNSFWDATTVNFFRRHGPDHGPDADGLKFHGLYIHDHSRCIRQQLGHR